MSASLLSFKKMIYAHCGLVLEGIAEDRLRKILQHNSKQAGCADLNAYERLVRSDQQQFDALICQLTVNETYFFREPEQLKLLTDVLIPQILARKMPSQPVRILSAGCSSGEEPYSLVMALYEIYGEKTAELFQIDAGDLDQNVLHKAQAGVYSKFSFRGVDSAVRQRYFQRQVQGYKLAEHIRTQVNFYQLNLLVAQFPAELVAYDIIFFRNVSIYFDLATRKLIQHKFYKLMNKHSILFLGSSETMGNDLGVFELVEHDGQYVFIKGDAYRPAINHAVSWSQGKDQAKSSRLSSDDDTHLAAIDPKSSVVATVDSVLPELQSSTEPIDSLGAVEDRRIVALERIQQLVSTGEPYRAMRLLERFPVSIAEDYGACLLKGWLLLNQQAFIEADQLLDHALNIEPWSVDAMLMKGLLYKWQQQPAVACQWFRKVIYSCPECWPAHFYLADTLRSEEQWAAAIQSYQTVLRIFAAGAVKSNCITWIPIPLDANDAQFLSQRHIKQLTVALHTTQVDD